MNEKSSKPDGNVSAVHPTDADMDLAMARRMNALNAAFYRDNAASFSATRHAAWPGWERCWCDAAQAGVVPDPPAGPASSQPLRILDLACGNLRFARFVQDRAPGGQVAYQAVDNCPGLAAGSDVPAGWSFDFHQLDIVSSLLNDTLTHEACSWSPDQYDLVVCFGFLHHVPTTRARQDLLRALLGVTRPGGLCCISFWRFMSEPRLAARARQTTIAACAELGLDPRTLGPGDYLLGWQNEPGAWRYCHHFSEEEIDALVASLADLATTYDRFASDGRSAALNEYLVLRRA